MNCQHCGAAIPMESVSFCPACGKKLMDSDIGEYSLAVWPEWKVSAKPIGKGSYGTVYKAVRHVRNIESVAAIKIISIPTDVAELESLRADGMTEAETKSYLQGIVDDFIGEVQLMESLKGVQNIVGVEDYEVVEKESQIGWDIYIRMELLTPFSTYSAGKTLTEEEVIKLGCDICTALEVCTQCNIIHRDIKPENIFVNRFGHFKLGDFGIARKLENMTAGLSQKGTFNYIAPEVVNSNQYDARVDTYSLGIVLYRLLNGNRLPFMNQDQQFLNANERRQAIDRRVMGEKLPAPCNASPRMAEVILKACEFDPNKRFSSATEMKEALMAVKNGTYIVTPPVQQMDKTVSVRKAPPVQTPVAPAKPAATPARPVVPPVQKPATPAYRSPAEDKTTAVRRAPVATQTPPPRPAAPKKKSKAPVLVVCLLVVCLLAIALIAGVAVSFLLKEGPSDNRMGGSGSIKTTYQAQNNDDSGITDSGSSGNTSNLKSVKVGDYIQFGEYEQDNNTANGKEAIDWLVLDVQDGKALVISKYALDCQPYNEEYEAVTWETCTLRNWLNNEFLNEAFSGTEKSKIPTVTVSADKNPSYDTDPGNATRDKVFLLSIEEANEYFSSDAARACEPTAYAKAQGVWVNDDNGNCWWWLRSPGYGQKNASSVGIDGWVSVSGYFVGNVGLAARPALWINLES